MRENGSEYLRKKEDDWRICVAPQVLDRFTLPFLPGSDEQKLLEQFRIDIDKRYAHGLVIGRFQPLHYGHIFLIKQALEIAQNITIGIGSCNKESFDNPWTGGERELRLVRVLEGLGLAGRISKIVRLHDFDDDDLWLEETLKKTGRVDGVVGNNDLVNDIFARWNFSVTTTHLYYRDTYEGRKIRKRLRGTLKSANFPPRHING